MLEKPQNWLPVQDTRPDVTRPGWGLRGTQGDRGDAVRTNCSYLTVLPRAMPVPKFYTPASVPRCLNTTAHHASGLRKPSNQATL